MRFYGERASEASLVIFLLWGLFSGASLEKNCCVSNYRDFSLSCSHYIVPCWFIRRTQKHTSRAETAQQLLYCIVLITQRRLFPLNLTILYMRGVLCLCLNFFSSSKWSAVGIRLQRWTAKLQFLIYLCTSTTHYSNPSMCLVPMFASYW